MTTCDFSSTETIRMPPRIGGDGEITEAKHAFRIASCFATDAAGNELPVVVFAAAELVCDLEWNYRPPYVVGDGE